MDFFYVELVFTLIVVLYKINTAKLNCNYLATYFFFGLTILIFLDGFRWFCSKPVLFMKVQNLLAFLKKKMQLTFHSLLPFGFSSKEYIFK